MFSRKLISPILVLLLLATGCSSPATVVSKPTDTLPPPTPTAISSETLMVPIPPQDTPVQASAGLIKIRFEQPIRVIPDALNPESQPAEIIAQYRDITSTMSEAWAGGTTSKAGAFSLLIDPASNDKTISLIFPVHVKITKKDVSIENLNLIVPMGGGGGAGGDFRIFSELMLQDGEYDLPPTDPNPALLSPLFPYTFNVTCSQPGAFDLTFAIPYSLGDASVTEELTDMYTVSIICPLSLTLWGEQNGQLQKIVRLMFQNGEYIQQP